MQTFSFYTTSRFMINCLIFREPEYTVVQGGHTYTQGSQPSRQNPDNTGSRQIRFLAYKIEPRKHNQQIYKVPSLADRTQITQVVDRNLMHICRAGLVPGGRIVLSQERTERSRTIPSFRKKSHKIIHCSAQKLSKLILLTLKLKYII